MIKKMLHILFWETLQNSSTGIIIGYFIWKQELSFINFILVFIFGSLSGLIIILTENTKIKVIPNSIKEQNTIKSIFSMLITFGIISSIVWYTVIRYPTLYNPIAIAILVGIGIGYGEWQGSNTKDKKLEWILHSIGMTIGSYFVVKMLPPETLDLWYYLGRMLIGFLLMSVIICVFDYYPRLRSK